MATTLKSASNATKPGVFKEVAPYQSQYGDAINKLTDAVVNRQQFSYDPNTDPSYQSYAKLYGRLGDRARINTLGDYAANTGGYASTAAVSAAQQAQNDYNVQLSNMIPQLMQAAYDRYQGEYNMNLGTLNALGNRDDALYGRWNDNRNYNRDVFESDRTYNYNKSTDDRDYAYRVARDKVADSQWASEFNFDKEKFNWSKQQGNSGSGGGSGRSGGGRSSSGGGSSSGTSIPTYKPMPTGQTTGGILNDKWVQTAQNQEKYPASPLAGKSAAITYNDYMEKYLKTRNRPNR